MAGGECVHFRFTAELHGSGRDLVYQARLPSFRRSNRDASGGRPHTVRPSRGWTRSSASRRFSFRRHVAGVPCRGSLGSKGKTASHPPPIPHDKMTEGGKPPALATAFIPVGRRDAAWLTTYGFPFCVGGSRIPVPRGRRGSLSLCSHGFAAHVGNLGCTRREVVGF